MKHGLDGAKVYHDFSSLKALKGLHKQDKNKAIEEVAQQFETMLMNTLMKSMRQANEAFKSDLFDSSKVDFYQDMLDQQLAMSMAQQGGLGLTEALVRQLQGFHAIDAQDVTGDDIDVSQESFEQAAAGRVPHENAEDVAVTTAQASAPASYDNPFDFIRDIMNDVMAVAREMGLDPRVLLSQAALETGWGKSILQHQDGSSSHNLFNIKADQRWDHDRVNVMTLEYRNGVAAKESANFRSYPSFRESVRDYVDFLRSNPRYEEALKYVDDPTRYTEELQKAGYATDPNYANKIMRIFSGDIIQQSMEQLGFK